MHKRIGAMHQRTSQKRRPRLSTTIEDKEHDKTLGANEHHPQFRNWRRYRDTVNELSRLRTANCTTSASRGDIPFVARKSV